MVRKKSKVKDTDLINRAKLIYLIEKLDTPKPKRDKALIALLYTSAARVSELLKDIKVFDLAIEKMNGVNFLVVYNVKCLKRRKGNEAKRNIPIHIEKEKEFIKYIAEYMKTLKTDDVMFPISRQTAYNIVRKVDDKLFPHYFRHLRLSHLATQYGFNSSELRQYTGWTDDKPAAQYVHLNWKDVARRMV